MSVAPLSEIGELVEPVSSWAPECDDPDGLFSYIDLSAVDQHDKIIASAREIVCIEAPSRARQVVREGDILVSTVRPNLNAVARVPSELDGATASTGFCVLRPRAGQLDSHYLYQWVKSPRFVSDMVRKTTGASYPAVSDRTVRESLIPLPPLPEQRRIAAILDKADELRAKRRAALAKLDRLTQSIFLDMFGDPAINPNSVGTKQLGDYLVFLTSGGRGWAKYYASTGDRFIRSLDVQMNHIGNKEAAYVSAPENAEARRTRVQVGDVLLTITGSRIGRVAPVTAELEGSFVSQHVAILRVDADRINPKFLSFFLSLESGGQRQIAKAQYGQTKPGLNFEQIQRFQVPIPAVEQQREFISRMAAVEKIKTSQLISVADLDALFTSLQHRAFRGEL